VKIQSRFKDYYDHISHRFGSDPDTVYVREPIRNNNLIEWPEGAGAVRGGKRCFLNTFDTRHRYTMEFVVAGMHVVAFGSSHDGSGVPEMLGPQHEHLLVQSWRNESSRPILPDSDQLTALVRRVGHPVFLVRGWHAMPGVAGHWRLEIAERIPVLKDLGFPAIISDQQMWQDIYQTLTTVLRKNPDKEPPVRLANDDRIHAAGFDLKSSFRHPVNEKRKK
jgi:hypothetical protein